MSATNDFDAEDFAHRKALAAYADVIETELGSSRLFRLAGTRHRHQSIVRTSHDRAMIVSVQIDFSRVSNVDELVEVIKQATRSPGSVPEA